MTDFQAAMGLSQLGKLESFIKRRRQIAWQYSRFFSRLRVKSLEGPAHRRSIFYRYIIMVDALEKIQTCLKEAGVVCERPVAKPLHHDFVDFRCPNSDEAYGRALSVPLYPSLSDAEISYVLETFDNVVV
jgi:dTDP-4-amino-4,6-dideoxygalactose transaminase